MFSILRSRSLGIYHPVKNRREFLMYFNAFNVVKRKFSAFKGINLGIFIIRKDKVDYAKTEYSEMQILEYPVSQRMHLGEFSSRKNGF